MAVEAVGASGLVVGADISLAMLNAASACASSATFRAVATDGEALAFRDASFDAVICQLGLMFFPHPDRGLAEARRVLRPGGCVAVCVIAAAKRVPMWGILAESLSRRLPDQATALNLSFALADVASLQEMFGAAGFREIRVQRERQEGIVDSFDEYWAPIEAGSGQLPQAYLALSPEGRRAVKDEVRERLSRFEVAGRLVMSAEMLIVSGRAQ